MDFLIGDCVYVCVRRLYKNNIYNDNRNTDRGQWITDESLQTTNTMNKKYSRTIILVRRLHDLTRKTLAFLTPVKEESFRQPTYPFGVQALDVEPVRGLCRGRRFRVSAARVL
jgi:hypothetical protein